MASKITLKSKDILGAVSKAAMWASPKSPIQAMQCIRLTCQDGVLSLSATDGSADDITIYMEVDDTEMVFDVCIPASMLLKKLKILAKSSSEIVFGGFGSVLTMRTSRHNSRINTVSPEYFPDLNRDINLDDSVEVKVLDLKEAITKTVAAADPNSPFPALEGVYLHGDDMVSADGTKIALYRDAGFIDTDALVRASALSKIARAIEEEQAVSLLKQNKKLYVVWDSGIVSSALIGYDFPDYNQLVPKTYETRFAVNGGELIEALELAAGDALESNNLVTINADKESVIISSRSSIGEHQSELDTTFFDGPPKLFGMSIKYLRDAVQKIKTADIYFGVNKPSSIIVLYDGDIYQYGIMPMYVKEG